MLEYKPRTIESIKEYIREQLNNKEDIEIYLDCDDYAIILKALDNQVVDELEKVKIEINKDTFRYPYEYIQGLKIASRIIDKCIAELKGEQSE